MKCTDKSMGSSCKGNFYKYYNHQYCRLLTFLRIGSLNTECLIIICIKTSTHFLSSTRTFRFFYINVKTYIRVQTKMHIVPRYAYLSISVIPLDIITILLCKLIVLKLSIVTYWIVILFKDNTSM